MNVTNFYRNLPCPYYLNEVYYVRVYRTDNFRSTEPVRYLAYINGEPLGYGLRIIKTTIWH